MFDKFTRSRIRALGADPQALGAMHDCAVLNAATTDYFGLGCSHERRLSMDLTSGEWSLLCSCGAYGRGASLLDAIDDWNAQLAELGHGDHAAIARASRGSPNVVPLRGEKR
ncbi:MAG: hypothetical protein RLW61_14330 [Gammaproteobacteria bacterium]